MQPFAERLALAASDTDPTGAQENDAAGAGELSGGGAAGAGGGRPSKVAREGETGARREAQRNELVQ